MNHAKSQIELIKIIDLATVQNLEIKHGQNLQIQFVSTQDILLPINLKITQFHHSTLKIIFVFKHFVELILDFEIAGNQTKTAIFNLVELSNDLSVKLNQQITTSFDNNKIEHKTKCLLDQNSQANIKHSIQADPETSNLELNQKIQTLILSPTAKVNMQPILQIQSQDVKCKHGATQGLLDLQSLFYLQARGLSLNYCKKLLTDVFKNEILEMVI